MSEIKVEDICIIEIGGDSCANCLAVLPEAIEIAKENGIGFISINVENEPQAIEKYEIERIPSIVLAYKGESFAKCSGYQPREILSLWVKAKIEERMKKGSDE